MTLSTMLTITVSVFVGIMIGMALMFSTVKDQHGFISRQDCEGQMKVQATAIFSCNEKIVACNNDYAKLLQEYEACGGK